jgi:RNA recognition motif-containing protein
MSLQSERSRGFGFVTMATEDDAKLCIEKLNGIVRQNCLHLQQ